MGKEAERFYWRCRQNAPDGPAAFYVHTAADEVEFKVREGSKGMGDERRVAGSLPEVECLSRFSVLERLEAAVAAIMGMSDAELAAGSRGTVGPSVSFVRW